MELNERIKDFWEADAEGYSVTVNRELNSPKKDAWVELVLEYAPKKDKLDILDVGTGPGFFPIVLSQAGHNVTGTDITENMIACAKRNAQAHGVSPTLLTMDCQQLDFPDDSFDLIICRNLTWTLDDPRKAYEQWLRVLRRGGRMLIFDANWNLHTVSEEATKEHERKIREIEEKYGPYDGRGHNNPDEIADISTKLFMRDKQRPQWDMDMMLSLGFSKVFADITVGARYAETEREKALQQVTPPFVVGGEK